MKEYNSMYIHMKKMQTHRQWLLHQTSINLDQLLVFETFHWFSFRA